jgi:hypothetical protein
VPNTEADPLPEPLPPTSGVPAAGGALPPRRSPKARDWSLTLAAGFVAGMASWLIGEALHGRLQPQLLSTGGMPSIEESQAGANAYRAAVALQMSVAYGSLGAALALALGLAGASGRRSSRVTSIAAALGAMLGGFAGALTPQILMPIYFRFYDPDSDDLPLAILILGGIGSAVGAAGGLSYGIGLGDRGRTARAALGGFLGALAGVVIYVVAGTLAFPLDQTTKPISATGGSRLLARLLVAILASAGATMSARIAPDIGPFAVREV